MSADGDAGGVDGEKKNHCTVTSNKVVFNHPFPCAVDFCGGSEGSEPALPPRRVGASGSAEVRGAGAGAAQHCPPGQFGPSSDPQVSPRQVKDSTGMWSHLPGQPRCLQLAAVGGAGSPWRFARVSLGTSSATATTFLPSVA